jgi:hypothetical protein
MSYKEINKGGKCILDSLKERNVTIPVLIIGVSELVTGEKEHLLGPCN